MGIPRCTAKRATGDQALREPLPHNDLGGAASDAGRERLLPDAWGFIWFPRAHLFALMEVEIETSLGRAKVKMPLAWGVGASLGLQLYRTASSGQRPNFRNTPEDHGLGLIVWDQDEVLLRFKRGRGLPKPDTDVKVGSNHRERGRPFGKASTTAT